MNAKLMRFYRKKLSNGRGTAARVIDFVMFRLFLVTLLFLITLYFFRSIKAAVLISIFLTAAASLALTAVNRKRIKRYIVKDLARIREKCLLEMLTFMTSGDFAAYMSRLLDGLSDMKRWTNGFTAYLGQKKVYVFHNHPKTRIEAADIIGVLRESDGPLVIVALSEYHEDVKTICAAAKRCVTLVPGSGVLKLAAQKDMLPDEEAAQQRAENEMKESLLTFEMLKSSALNKAKAARYVVCGVVVLLWSLVTGFRFYYPIIAAACFVLALLSTRARGAAKESSDIDLS